MAVRSSTGLPCLVSIPESRVVTLIMAFIVKGVGMCRNLIKLAKLLLSNKRQLRKPYSTIEK